jgi:hypothetical protein
MCTIKVNSKATTAAAEEKNVLAVGSRESPAK